MFNTAYLGFFQFGPGRASGMSLFDIRSTDGMRWLRPQRRAIKESCHHAGCWRLHFSVSLVAAIIIHRRSPSCQIVISRCDSRNVRVFVCVCMRVYVERERRERERKRERERERERMREREGVSHYQLGFSVTYIAKHHVLHKHLKSE